MRHHKVATENLFAQVIFHLVTIFFAVAWMMMLGKILQECWGIVNKNFLNLYNLIAVLIGVTKMSKENLQSSNLSSSTLLNLHCFLWSPLQILKTMDSSKLSLSFFTIYMICSLLAKFLLAILIQMYAHNNLYMLEKIYI